MWILFLLSVEVYGAPVDNLRSVCNAILYECRQSIIRIMEFTITQMINVLCTYYYCGVEISKIKTLLTYIAVPLQFY